MSNIGNTSGIKTPPSEPLVPRSGRKRRATRGNLRRQTNLDGVIVEETLSFLMPGSTTNSGIASAHYNNGSNNTDKEEVGDGCYISSTINNRRYYGLLIEQSALLKASELHFMEEAASIEINRRMMFLHEKQKKKNSSTQAPPSNSSGPSIKQNNNMDITLQESSNKKQKIEEVPSNSYVETPHSSTMQQQVSTMADQNSNEKVIASTTQKHPRPKSIYNNDKQVQKFEYIRPSVIDKNSPGYRKLLASYANIAAASEDRNELAVRIYNACESGGDFVGEYYFQYLVDESTIQARHAAPSNDSMNGFRTSLSFHTFLRNVLLPQWYPLANFKVDQSKILNMLQMKRNNKGGVEWTSQKSPANPVIQVIPTLVPTRQPLYSLKPRNTYRIGVLGGGISGIACAAELLRIANEEEKLEIEVTLIEGRDRVGGRLWTDTKTFKSLDGKEFPIDLGASWIHGIEKNPLTDLAKEANVDFVRASEEVKMLTSNMREVDKDCDKRMGKLFDDLLDHAADDCWNSTEYIFEEGRYQKAVRWYASNLSNTNGSGNSNPTPTDVEQFRYTSDISIDRAIGLALKKREDSFHLTRQDHNLLLWNTKNTEYALGANITDLSMKYWDTDERHAFRGDHVLLKQGYSKIVEHLYNKCKEYPSFKSILNFPIGRVEYARQSASLPYPNRKLRHKRCITLSDTCAVYSTDSKQENHTFDFVVCALPLGVLKESLDTSQTNVTSDSRIDSMKSQKIVFHPPLPESKRDAIKTVGFGLLNKVYLEFPYAFWRKKGNREFFRGFPFLGDEQDLFGNASGFNAHHYMFFDVGRSLYGGESSNTPHILLTLISGREAVASERMTEKELVQDVMNTLRHLFSTIQIPQPITVKRTQWGSDKFSRGSYTYLPPGSTDQDYQSLQSPVNGRGDSVHASIRGDSEVMRLFWAGEHTTSLHPSMAHGALLSGIRAAREVITATEVKASSDDIAKRDHLIPVTLFRSRRPTEPVRCSLCHFPGSRRREGALCAFQRGKQQSLVHTNCASYCPEVEVKHGVWKHVLKAVIRGRQISCSLCRRNGATIGCVHSQCVRSFHFGCCEDTGWSFVQNGKAFLCDLHRVDMFPGQDYPISIPYFRSKNPFTPVKCHFCGSVGDTDRHGKLLGFQRGSRQQVLVHSNCLRYSTVIDTWDSSSHTFQNVFEAVFGAEECTSCRNPGATVECAESSCENRYHFTCAEDTGWSFQSDDSDFKCVMHRGLSHVAKPKDSKMTTNSSKNKNDESKQRTGFIQHDLFCTGALASKGSDAVPVPVENDKDIQQLEDQQNISSIQLENNLTSSEEAEDDDDDDDDEYDQSESDDENDEEIEEENLMQPFTIDPHTADEEIGRTYVHNIRIKANRFSTANRWKIDLVIDRSTSSKTTTLRVFSNEKDAVPFGMKRGDIIVAINNIKIGSPSLSIITQVLSLMKGSVELELLVLRKGAI